MIYLYPRPGFDLGNPVLQLSLKETHHFKCLLKLKEETRIDVRD